MQILYAFASLLGGIILDSWLKPLSSDLGLLVACLGIAGCFMFIWKYARALKRFDEIKARNSHQH